MPRIKTITVKEFLKSSGIPMRRGDHPILMEETDTYLSDMPEFLKVMVDEDEEYSESDSYMQKVLDTIVPKSNDKSIRWNAYCSETSAPRCGMTDYLEMLTPLDKKLYRANSIDYKSEHLIDPLLIIWDKTGCMVSFDGPCPRQFIMYYE